VSPRWRQERDLEVHVLDDEGMIGKKERKSWLNYWIYIEEKTDTMIF